VLVLIATSNVGLEVRRDKSQYLVMSSEHYAGKYHTVKTGNKSVGFVQQFRYLGTILTNQKFPSWKN